MNFPFHEFKHLIDQNNNINSNNRSFNKTQRVKSIQEGQKNLKQSKLFQLLQEDRIDV